MEYPLAITTLAQTDPEGPPFRSNAVYVMATADLDPSPGSQSFVFGRFVDVSEEKILEFKQVTAVNVRFRGKEYRSEELEKNGVFKLVQC